MMITSVLLFGLSLFCKWIFAASETPPLASTECEPWDLDCREADLPEDERRHGIDIPWIDTESGLMRLNPAESMVSNDVYCWPSVGGIITGQRLHAVEVDYIGLDRFNMNPRSFNTTEEDDFCMRLRKVGGKWWEYYEDFNRAMVLKMRRMWPDEREVLFLGWPETGGVWVLRYENRWSIGDGLGAVWNAFNMEERCMALEKAGAIFFKNPYESEHVRPLLEGFGNRERRRDPEYEDGGQYAYQTW